MITGNSGWHGFALIVEVNSSVPMNGGIITNNTGAIGAIHTYSEGTFTLDGGIIKNNIASSSSGGIAATSGTYTYKSGTVCGNTPTNGYETHATCPG